MGSKSSAPPPPDYTPVAQASEKQAKYNFQLGKEQLAWAKEQYASDRNIADKVIGAALERQALNDTSAAKDRSRYEALYQPLEDAAVRDAQSFSTPERQQLEMGRAEAAVGQQFDAARASALRNLEAFGVDPSSTRFAALDAGSRLQEAAAKAGAANQAQAQTEAIGRAMRGEAINVGRGYPGQIAGTYATALQSGNQGLNSALATTASGANTMGTAPQYQGLANQAVGTWGNTLNMGYNNQLAAAQFNAQQSSGIGSLAGALLGAAGSAGGFGALFEEGGQVGAGQTVPASASPSRGAAIDDVPAAINGGGQARINVGEFIVPKDVVDWKGEEFFQRLIEGARKAKPQAPAQPKMAAIPTSSRPAGALPVG